MWSTRVVRAGVAVGLAAAFLAGCGSSGGGSDDATTTKPQFVTTTAAATTTVGGTASTTAAVTSTTAGGGTATTGTEPANWLKPGDPCSLEEGSPDCIDPENDGEGVYLIGGAACMADSPDPAMCADLDGDGYAGYPDSQ